MAELAPARAKLFAAGCLAFSPAHKLQRDWKVSKQSEPDKVYCVAPNVLCSSCGCTGKTGAVGLGGSGALMKMIL